MANPRDFSPFSILIVRQSQNITEQYWVALEIKGKEASNTVGEINSASFKHLGGIFLEEIGTPVITQRGIGSVKFTGSLIKGTEEVESTVPECCTTRLIVLRINFERHGVTSSVECRGVSKTRRRVTGRVRHGEG